VSTVRTETDGPVLIVTIDRPQVRNAVNGPTAARLAEVFRAFDADGDLRDENERAAIEGLGARVAELVGRI